MTKKLFYLLILLIPFMLGSCKDDKDEPSNGKDEVSSTSIVGTWTGYYYDDGETGTFTLIFKKDHTFVWKYSWSDGEKGFEFGSYKYDPDASILILTYKGDEDGDYDDYDTEYCECFVKGNKLVLNIVDESITITFTKS